MKCKLKTHLIADRKLDPNLVAVRLPGQLSQFMEGAHNSYTRKAENINHIDYLYRLLIPSTTG